MFMVPWLSSAPCMRAALPPAGGPWMVAFRLLVSVPLTYRNARGDGNSRVPKLSRLPDTFRESPDTVMVDRLCVVTGVLIAELPLELSWPDRSSVPAPARVPELRASMFVDPT